MELRLQAIRTTGLLGAVDESVYHEHLRKSGGVVDAFSSQSDHVEEEAEEESSNSSGQGSGIVDGEKIMTKIEKYYFTVVIRELMNILKDSNLNSHHQAASAIAVRVFRILGSQAQSSLNAILEGIVNRLYQTEPGNNLRDALLDHRHGRAVRQDHRAQGACRSQPTAWSKKQEVTRPVAPAQVRPSTRPNARCHSAAAIRRGSAQCPPQSTDPSRRHRPGSGRAPHQAA